MTKADLAEKIEGIDFSKKESINLVESVLDFFKDNHEAGEDIKMHGFGNFQVRRKKDRKGRNPQTGGTLKISGRRVVTFKPSQVLKDLVSS